MPARAKPPDRRQRRRSPAEGDGPRIRALPSRYEAPPDPPSSLGKRAAAEWEAFWASPVSKVVDRSDLPALERLFELRDERRRVLRQLLKTRWVPGSQGQPRLNPLSGYLVQVEGAILSLEKEFGLTPASRLRLGISAYDVAKALEEVNAEAEEGADTSPFMETEEGGSESKGVEE